MTKRIPSIGKSFSSKINITQYTTFKIKTIIYKLKIINTYLYDLCTEMNTQK